MKKEEQKANIKEFSEFSKIRVNSMKSIGLKFPKLASMDANPKVQEAIKKMYKEANLLEKYPERKHLKRKSVSDIIEKHSPVKVL